MTAYVSIPNSDVDPESPITTSLMIALRDNPTAITEGSSGAPKVQTAGIQDLAVTGAKMTGYTAGDYSFSGIDGNGISSAGPPTTLTKVIEALLGQGGTIRTFITFSNTVASGGGFSATVQIYKNSVAFGTLHTFTIENSSTTYTEDLAFSAGDLLQVYVEETQTIDAYTITTDLVLRTATMVTDVAVHKDYGGKTY